MGHLVTDAVGAPAERELAEVARAEDGHDEQISEPGPERRSTEVQPYEPVAV